LIVPRPFNPGPSCGPPPNFRQREVFTAVGCAAWWAFGLTFTGWLLAFVLVAGLAGVFKRG
jgi:hypothetical protein